MSSWNPSQYLRFGVERTRPASDLVARINVTNPRTVIDLGCGPGNSTQVLRSRWPHAHVIGLDHSSDMITAARATYPDKDWMLGNVANWSDPNSFDVVFSNAALQWLEDHDRLIPHLLTQVISGGALAFQIPSNKYAAVRLHIHEVANDSTWRATVLGLSLKNILMSRI